MSVMPRCGAGDFPSANLPLAKVAWGGNIHPQFSPMLGLETDGISTSLDFYLQLLDKFLRIHSHSHSCIIIVALSIEST